MRRNTNQKRIRFWRIFTQCICKETVFKKSSFLLFWFSLKLLVDSERKLTKLIHPRLFIFVEITLQIILETIGKIFLLPFCSLFYLKHNVITVQKQSARSLRLATLFKKRLWHRCFRVNFEKFLRTPIFRRTPLMAAAHCSSSIDVWRKKEFQK